MKDSLSRLPVLVLALALFSATPVAFGQSSTNPAGDAKKAAEEAAKSAKKAAEDEKKAAKKAAEDAKKAEEDARKAEEKAQKAEEKARKTAINRKNTDVDNIGNRNINKGSINFSSIEDEIAAGKAVAAEIDRQVQLVQDPVVAEYVNRVGQNLVANSDAVRYPFTIKVVDSDEINAFALPGGYFYVNTGVILAAEDEAELAGVMAHEIAHVAARHAMENESKARLFDILTIPVMIVGGPVGMAARQLASIAIPMQFISFSKKAEKEADFLGIQYLYKTGYDPSAAVSFFEKLQAKEQAKPGTITKLFSSHPPTDDRIIATKAQIEVGLEPRERYVVTTSEFQRVKNRLLAMQNNTKVEEDDKRPSLRRRTPSGGDTGSNGGDAEETTTRPEDRAPADDDRPVLQRRN